jgi:hypothetical protein
MARRRDFREESGAFLLAVKIKISDPFTSTPREPQMSYDLWSGTTGLVRLDRMLYDNTGFSTIL